MMEKGGGVEWWDMISVQPGQNGESLARDGEG